MRDVHDPQYGMPGAVFAFVETLSWFSQAIRSGTWTYFEATPVERQEALRAQLFRLAPVEFAEQYGRGMKYWRDQSKIKDVDRWISENEPTCNDWLFSIALQSRGELRLLYA